MDSTACPPRSEIAVLYTDHHRWLTGWLARKLGNSADAADVAQDTFMRLLNGERSEATREPRALLTTVAQRVLFNLYRRRKIETAYLQTLEALPTQWAPSPETRAIVLQTLLAIDRVLAELPVPVREAFLFSQIDGLKQSEIAQRLGLSIATVQRHIVRAVHACYFQ